MGNPFVCNSVVSTGQFVGRKSQFRRLRDCICAGSAAVVVGDPKIGKTSLLKFMSAYENRPKYGNESGNLYFQYIDMHPFDESIGPSQFWHRVIEPIYEAALNKNSTSSLSRIYTRCIEDNFHSYINLAKFFKELETLDLKLVLLLDEFDAILDHAQFNTRYFLGAFRSLASLSHAFAPVLAARTSVVQLNCATTKHNDGSPYFNVFNEITLGPFEDKECAKLLSKAEGKFTVDDRRCLIKLTGGHPHFLQVSASELWYAYLESPDDSDKRWRNVEEKLYREATAVFTDLWQRWTSDMRIAFILVALPQMQLERPKFRIRKLPVQLRNRKLTDELSDLERRGLIVKDPESDSGWRVCSPIGLWWLAGQIAQEIYDEETCRQWLQKQQVWGPLTKQEQKSWFDFMKSLGEVLRDNAKPIIEMLAKVLGERLST